jgi:hypothetical protein
MIAPDRHRDTRRGRACAEHHRPVRQYEDIAGYPARIDDPDIRRPRCPTIGLLFPEAGPSPWTTDLPMTIGSMTTN